MILIAYLFGLVMGIVLVYIIGRYLLKKPVALIIHWMQVQGKVNCDAKHWFDIILKDIGTLDKRIEKVEEKTNEDI